MELTPSQIKKIDLWVRRVVFILSIIMTIYVVTFTLKHSPPAPANAIIQNSISNALNRNSK